MVQLNGEHLFKARTVRSQIDGDIQNPAESNPDQFGLGVKTALKVQSTEDTVMGLRLVILNKKIGKPAVYEIAGMVTFIKPTAIIVMYFWLENQ